MSYLAAGMNNFRADVFLLLLLSGFLSASGSSALNNYFDRDIDGIMNRTKLRPLASCKINPKAVLFIGALMVLSGVLIASLINLLTAFFVMAGALIYNWIYTVLLKRRSPINIVIGGFAGSCCVLAGFSAADGYISLQAVLLSILVFLWTPTHFWSFALIHKEDYRKAGIPMLPAIIDESESRKYITLNTLFLLIFSFFIYLSGFGIIYLFTSILAGILMGYLAFSVLKKGKYVYALYKFSGIYLGVLFLGAVVDLTLF